MKILVQYVRKQGRKELLEDGTVKLHRGKPVGIVVAVGKGKIGWSLCNKTDRWDKEVGKSLAIGRAIDDGRTEIELRLIPSTVFPLYLDMVRRSEKYFSRKKAS